MQYKVLIFLEKNVIFPFPTVRGGVGRGRVAGKSSKSGAVWSRSRFFSYL